MAFRGPKIKTFGVFHRWPADKSVAASPHGIEYRERGEGEEKNCIEPSAAIDFSHPGFV